MRLSFIAELVIFDNSSFHPAGERRGPVFKAELATELGLRCGLGGGFRLRQMATNARMKKTLEAWKSSRIPASDAHFEDHEIHALTVEFLTGWRERNFGALAHFPSRQFGKRPTTPGQMAGQLRDVFEGFVPIGVSRDRARKHRAGHLVIQGRGDHERLARNLRAPLDQGGGRRQRRVRLQVSALAPRVRRPLYLMASKRIDDGLIGGRCGLRPSEREPAAILVNFQSLGAGIQKLYGAPVIAHSQRDRIGIRSLRRLGTSWLRHGYSGGLVLLVEVTVGSLHHCKRRIIQLPGASRRGCPSKASRGESRTAVRRPRRSEGRGRARRATRSCLNSLSDDPSASRVPERAVAASTTAGDAAIRSKLRLPASRLLSEWLSELGYPPVPMHF